MPNKPSEPCNLTSREIECLTELSEGNSCSKIASHLHISVSTVAMHLKNARRKLHAATREQAVALALRTGILK